jgi:hypothetical protein
MLELMMLVSAMGLYPQIHWSQMMGHTHSPSLHSISSDLPKTELMIAMAAICQAFHLLTRPSLMNDQNQMMFSY